MILQIEDNYNGEYGGFYMYDNILHLNYYTEVIIPNEGNPTDILLDNVLSFGASPWVRDEEKEKGSCTLVVNKDGKEVMGYYFLIIKACFSDRRGIAVQNYYCWDNKWTFYVAKQGIGVYILNDEGKLLRELIEGRKKFDGKQ